MPPLQGIDRDFNSCVVELPQRVLPPRSWTPQNLLEWVCEGCERIPPAQWYQCYATRTVVTPTHIAADALNEVALLKLPGNAEMRSLGRDTACAEVDSGETYATDFFFEKNPCKRVASRLMNCASGMGPSSHVSAIWRPTVASATERVS